MIYLDLDGVLADYDKAADALCGMSHYRYEFIYGKDAYAERVFGRKNFWLTLEPMRDSVELLMVVPRFKILTALPKTNKEAAADHKRLWCHLNLGVDDADVITCMTPEKPDYCQPGDVLVDDRYINKGAWEAKGGHYVHHTDARTSVTALKELGVL